MHALIDLARVSSFRRLRHRTPLGTSGLEIAKSDGIWSSTPIFFLTVLFQRERDEALFIMGLILRFMVKSEEEKDMEAGFLRTSDGGSSICGVEELA
jgi:hypothetical protein